MKPQYKSAICAIALFSCTGCAGFGMQLKNWLNGGGTAESPLNEPTKYSDRDNVEEPTKRDYNHMTKARLMKEAELGEHSGSLWQMDGQGGYLFAQNNSRLLGDLLTVNLEGQPRKQLLSKVRIIKDLIDQYEKQAAEDTASANSEDGSDPQVSAQDPAAKPDSAQQAKAGSDSKPASKPGEEDGDKIFDVHSIATQVMEKTKDGSYRIQGEQSFMIGSREYRVLVKGIVRPEDFSEAGVNAERLLDSKFDIISSNSTSSQKGMTL